MHATKVRDQGARHQLVPADHLARMLDQGDQKVERIAKTNLLLAFQQKSLCRKQAEGAERDRSLVRDDGSNRPIELLFSELNLTVRGCRHPADLSRGRGRHAGAAGGEGSKIGIGDASRCHHLPHHRA